MSDEPRFLLVKRGLYWRPNGKGYTGLKSEAGLYTLEDAAMSHGEYKTHYGENAVTEYILFEDAPEYAPACCTEVKIRHLEERVAKMDEMQKVMDKLSWHSRELVELLCLADETIMGLHGCFPMDRCSPQTRQLHQSCCAIREVTGEDFYNRRHRGNTALQRYRRKNGQTNG